MSKLSKWLNKEPSDRLRTIVFVVATVVSMSAVVSSSNPNGWFISAMDVMATKVYKVSLSKGTCLNQNYWPGPLSLFQKGMESSLGGKRTEYKIVGFDGDWAYKVATTNHTTFITEKTRLSDYTVVNCEGTNEVVAVND